VTARLRVVVTRPVAPEALDALRARCDVRVLTGESALPDASEVKAGIADADILFTMPGHPASGEVLSAAPRLRLVATLGTGYDNIDLIATRARGIPVTNAPGILDETTADLAFALMLAAARRLGESERFLRTGAFRGWRMNDFLGLDIHRSTLGIVGLGRIGQAVAKRARGFEMRILYTGPRRKRPEDQAGAQFVALPELLRTADVVSLHAPLSPATRHLIGAAELAQMKPTAILINTARGPMVDEAALAAALKAGALAAAGLDVYEREPQVLSELLTLENVVLTPHIGSATQATRRRMALRAVDNIFAFLDGRPLLNLVP